ncbi:hypothetical protein NG774_11640 [Aliarcobacter cryaerophilus]|uniref:hypothetical protein n=1 Tax=Aliarcobacter cryaerophilus TaxID=28198 RepID=UPI003DA327E1
MILTKHLYISKYPINQFSKSLILGTIHPHNDANNISNFKIDFFYGNKNSLWTILSEAKNIRLDTLNQILDFLSQNEIAVSDMILECERKNNKVTADKDLYNLVLNEELKNEILKSDIETIYFTSAFNKNNAAKLFFDLFELQNQIPINWKDTYEININFFCKQIKCVILLSPSGASNIGISKSKIYLDKINEYIKFKTPFKQFKIDFYKEKF